MVPVEVVFICFFLVLPWVPPLVSAIFCTKVLSVNCHTDSGGCWVVWWMLGGDELWGRVELPVVF